jgi:hypothetical protein
MFRVYLVVTAIVFLWACGYFLAQVFGLIWLFSQFYYCVVDDVQKT